MDTMPIDVSNTETFDDALANQLEAPSLNYGIESQICRRVELCKPENGGVMRVTSEPIFAAKSPLLAGAFS